MQLKTTPITQETIRRLVTDKKLAGIALRTKPLTTSTQVQTQRNERASCSCA